MATTINELPVQETRASGVRYYWAINVFSDNAAIAQIIRPSETGKKHWINYIKATCIYGTADWFELLDGNNILIGPVYLIGGSTYEIRLFTPIHFSLGSPIKLLTNKNSATQMILEGFTDP